MATVLIVDDEDVMLEALALAVGGLGHRPLTATDGDEALTRLFRQRVDLVIADVKMPRRSGVELVGAMRRTPLLAHIPVALTSAIPPDEPRARGAFTFLPEPASLRDLQA